jgi:hypothetical protein
MPASLLQDPHLTLDFRLVPEGTMKIVPGENSLFPQIIAELCHSILVETGEYLCEWVLRKLTKENKMQHFRGLTIDMGVITKDFAFNV